MYNTKLTVLYVLIIIHHVFGCLQIYSGYSGSGTLLEKICVPDPPPELTSIIGIFHVRWFSRTSSHGTGFQAIFGTYVDGIYTCIKSGHLGKW